MCNCSEHESSGSLSKMTAASVEPAMKPQVPLSRQISFSDEESGDQPAATGLQPFPPFRLCRLDFREGCYQINFRPTAGFVTFEGTLRVDRSAPDGGADHLIVSGDLYSRRPVIGPIPPVGPVVPVGDADGDEAAAESGLTSLAGSLSALDEPLIPFPIRRPRIPIFPRARYHSYLRVTSVSAPVAVPLPKKCELTIVAEQFNYTQPPAGQFKGTFPASPSRTVTMKLSKVPAPFPFSLTGGPFYQGRLFEGGVDKGSITLAWVSKFFRRATLEIDTLVGAVRPAPVPDGAGGTEFFDTVFAKTGWQLSVVQDQLNVPVPSGVVATNCWSSADLHALMTTVRNPATNLDTEWRVHMIVVPAKLGCSRGIMYDQIGVPREGCASFSDDGYPVSDSSNFGLAANKKQRDVPRAFLRSATHELTHTLNQIHQEQETAADNSIMTTTPSVADVLGGPATGEPGVFPDQIKLAHNTNVRHHLNHMPDPVIRPGGWPFASWFPTGAPQAADRHDFEPSELALTVTATTDRVALGQPLDLTWTMTNTSGVSLRAPNDVSIEALFASITVTDGEGHERPVRPFVILCEHAKLTELEPGKSVTASAKVFWSTAGFAFEKPGRYRVDVAVSWSAQGVMVGVQSGIDVFVDYPTSASDNHSANLVLHPEVGKWVALGGDAYHLGEACRRLQALSQTAVPSGARAATAAAGDDTTAPRAIDGFADMLPDRAKLARLRPELSAETGGRTPRGPARAAAPGRKRAAKAKGRRGRKR
ncbi:hypothetical protein ABIF44_000351 [Bradyrhizobium japonicum]|nr:hypothetical protein RN69_28245 [Bradyrhizobium japonicum]BAL11083.1 hypothetical protein BJ6T_58280 [Bradyrhizobium japonicum USDA 6]KMJ95527.1 hypothetical protein CF64_30460 [Bradyrhizobium japonicum]MBR0760249.1 hypothetical protein [Bradyrhizobium japonicum]MDH6173643.1 hypothetical protein [Bradyrhizobium japonicum]